jgi:YfiH family protein
MPFHQPDNLRYYTFDLLDEAVVNHAVFTRQGGLSPSPWDSLNVGATVGDDPERVRENRQRSVQALGRTWDSVYDAWQVHSAVAVCADAPRPPDQAYVQADILLTDRPEVTLYMRFADCVPILLYDPVRQVVGLVHAGWLGTVRRAASAAVQTMQAQYSTNPADIQAGIGPSIGVHHYQVGPEVAGQVEAVFGEAAQSLLPEYNGSVHFDLWSANHLLLSAAGVVNIQISGICTACHLDDWFSHRGENGRTGRFGALINLKGQ